MFKKGKKSSSVKASKKASEEKTLVMKKPSTAKTSATGKTSVKKKAVSKKKTAPVKTALKKKASPKKTASKKKAAPVKTALKKKTAPKKAAASKTVTKKKAAPVKTTLKKKAAVSKIVIKKKAVPVKTVAKKKAAPKKTASKKKIAPPKTVSKKRVASKNIAPIKPPFAAYNGIRPYCFTSYAHKNMKEVFQVIKKLNNNRYRIWYDEGIEPGNEWPEVVGTAIIKCDQFLVFMSPHAAESRNVRNEINLAFSEHKNILVVFLQKTNLSEGMRLQIGTVQFINKFELSDKEFYDKITRVLDNKLKN